MKKFIIIAVAAIAVYGFYALGLNEYLSLEGIKSNLDQFNTWKNTSFYLVATIFTLVYIIAAALSIPGAAILTLAAGALFGLLWGTVIVSFASTIGATLAFLVSRFILRDSVQAKFGDRLDALNKGIEKEGGFYLFTLRLVPAVPFFLINLLMGLTKIKTLTFYWVSQLGMLTGTIVYVNAGTQLAQIDSVQEILSFGLAASFVLLGVFPILAKRALDLLKQRRVYAKWEKPKTFDRNLIVIGGGAAGLVSAYIAAAVKAKVTLVEAHKMGGDCLNYGCIPSKAIIKSAKLAQQMQAADKYGLETSAVKVNFKRVMSRVHDIIKAIEPHDSVERYTKLGVDVVQGYCRLIDPWTVEITHTDGAIQRLTARSIIIAAGASPVVPPLPGIDEVGYLTSDTLWDEFAKLDEIPKRLVVLGGGPIGSELTQSFARLGAQVTQVEMAERIMAREDKEVSEYTQQVFEAEGVSVLTQHQALRCETHGDKKYLVVQDLNDTDKQEKQIEFDALVCAVGRRARLTGYGLEDLGINVDRTVTTNDYLETLYPNIFAAGDVAGPYQFTHTAAHMAWYASVNALFGQVKKFKVDYSVIPWATFVDPEVARVGLNEQEAKDRNIAYEVTRYDLDDLDRAIADSSDVGFVKVLTVPGKDKILGVTIMGTHAGDLLAEFVLAMKHGLGLNKILGTIHTYPTLAEANKYVAGEWKRAHQPEKLLAWLERYHQWRRGDSQQ